MKSNFLKSAEPAPSDKADEAVEENKEEEQPEEKTPEQIYAEKQAKI